MLTPDTSWLFLIEKSVSAVINSLNSEVAQVLLCRQKMQ